MSFPLFTSPFQISYVNINKGHSIDNTKPFCWGSQSCINSQDRINLYAAGEQKNLFLSRIRHLFIWLKGHQGQGTETFYVCLLKCQWSMAQQEIFNSKEVRIQTVEHNASFLYVVLPICQWWSLQLQKITNVCSCCS